MPTAAMERSMDEYSGFSTGSPTKSGPARDQARRRRSKAQQEREREERERKSLVAKAEAMAKIAQNMSDQNEKMLAGIEAAARFSNMGMDGEPLRKLDTAKVDFVARNRVNVGPDRDMIGRRERAMMAKAEIMSAATEHLGPNTTGAAPAPAARRRRPVEEKPDESDELIRAAMEEMQRGDQLTAIETATRRPASMRLLGSGANGGISMRGGRGGRGASRGRGRSS
eukprot:COSAG02_NODE_2503_length_8671_cov_20.133108_7_plen_226_part_00